MTNKELTEKIFSNMRSWGFEPYNIEYGDGYFVFNMGEDSVIHFRVKGIWKHWKFGMWLDANSFGKDDEIVAQIFCQYDEDIDKFKPSASTLCVRYKKDVTDGWFENSLEDMLKMIKKHPLICYADFCGEHTGYTDISFLKYFLHGKKYTWKNKIICAVNKIIWLPYIKAKIALMKHSKYVDTIEFKDFEKENPGWSTSYLYNVRVFLAKDAEEDDIIKFVGRWFHKDHYGMKGTWLHEYIIQVEYYIFNKSKQKYEQVWIGRMK